MMHPSDLNSIQVNFNGNNAVNILFPDNQIRPKTPISNKVRKWDILRVVPRGIQWSITAPLGSLYNMLVITPQQAQSEYLSDNPLKKRLMYGIHSISRNIVVGRIYTPVSASVRASGHDGVSLPGGCRRALAQYLYIRPAQNFSQV